VEQLQEQVTLDAKARWTHASSARQQVLDRARDCSKLTIPGLLPPEGHTDNTPLSTPYQSLGARGVNNLASKLLLALLPPGTSFFRLQIAAAIKATLNADTSQKAEAKLAEIEQAVSKKIETTTARPVLFESLKHLVVSGNVLLHMPDSGLKMYRMDQYVVCRAPNGAPIDVVIKEAVNPKSIKPTVRIACDVPHDQKDNVDVYTVIEWSADECREYQEINGKLVPGSVGERPIKKSEWFPLRWQAVPGQNWGRGLCEEYLGDLMSLEGIYEALLQFAASAAKIIFLVHPASSTNIEDLNKAKSGQSVVGNKLDIDVLQMDKYADFQVVKAAADDLTLRLSHAFLLRSGTVRNAERVTAEEIRDTAQEIEDVLGGTYTVLAVELQLPFVRRQMAMMQQKGEIQQLPEGIVDPVIVTGFEALGRNHSVNKLRAWLADIRANLPEAVGVLKFTVIVRRLGVGYGLEDLDSMIKTDDEIAEDQQQTAAANAASQAIGPVAGAISKGMIGQQ